MQDVCDRAERSGALAIGRFELTPIENAAIECESIIKQLDVTRLYHARIKVLHAATMARALNKTKPALEVA